jgi:large subunit ribosomal protein L7e
MSQAKSGKKEMEIEKHKEFVPENVTKKKKRDGAQVEARKARRTKAKGTAQERRKEYALRGEKYATEYKQKAQSMVDEKRKARAAGGFYVPAEAKVALVVRIRGINCLSPTVRKTLQLFKLRQLHNASFVRINKATINMLRKIEPFIAYGYPNHQTIKQLVYKRGYAKVNRQRIPITSNVIIEEHLGKHGIICIEDLIHEVVTCGPHFKEVNSFLWTFKLTSPRDGFNNKRHPFHQGGDWGNREDKINDLVQRMI